MYINILKKGDEFVGLYGSLIAIRKSNGEVELTELITDENGCMRLESSPKITIGYGENVIKVSSSDKRVEVMTF